MFEQLKDQARPFANRKSQLINVRLKHSFRHGAGETRASVVDLSFLVDRSSIQPSSLNPAASSTRKEKGVALSECLVPVMSMNIICDFS